MMPNSTEDWSARTHDEEYSDPEYCLQNAPSGSYGVGDVNDDDDGGGAAEEQAIQTTPASASDCRRRDEREANRIHCRETRERKRQNEKLLREVCTV